MFAAFEDHFREKIKLSDADIDLMSATATTRALRRRDILVHEGEVCRYKIFILKGILRTYRTKEDGSEHIMQFSPENTWTTEPESFHKLTPSLYTIDAVESSEVVYWTKTDFEHLYEQIPALKNYTEQLISHNMSIIRERLYSGISSTAEEKYDQFIKDYPDVFARVPLHMVASFLGVTRETLSRIRHAEVRR